MTKEEFKTAVEAKPNFIKWAKAPAVNVLNGQPEVYGDIEKHHGLAYISTPDGTNTYNVWFMVDTATGEATWQSHDTMEPEKNTADAKLKVLNDYIDANFVGGFVIRMNLDENYAEAEVYEAGIGRKTILVYKPQGQAVTHIDA